MNNSDDNFSRTKSVDSDAQLSNLFRAIPSELPQELFTPLVHADKLKIERIVSQGHSSPAGFWYDQAQSEWLLLLTGEAKIQFQNQPEVHLKPGDTLNIPAHQKHRVSWTTLEKQTIWLAVHYEMGPE
jgi:cupin 2 domain-containing protein